MTEETEVPPGIFFSAGRLKAIIDLMDNDLIITSDGEKMSIGNATGTHFVGLLYPLDQGTSIPKGTWSSISLSHLKRLMTLLPSDQLRREEMAAAIEAEGGKRIPPEIMELKISMTSDAVEFVLGFNQFTFDEIKLRMPAIFSEESDISRIGNRKKPIRDTKKRRHRELSPKPDTATISSSTDLKPV